MSARACVGRGGKGCPCRPCVDRRAYAAQWRRERRTRQVAELLKTAYKCPRPVAPRGRCNGALTTSIGTLGQTVVSCAWCERREAGLCRDCSLPVYGQRRKAIRCARHAEVAKREQLRRYTERNHEEVLRRARAAYADPDVKARRNEYKRLWRKNNPDKVRAYKKQYIERHAGDPSSAYVRYHQKYRAKYRDQKRLLERERLAATPAVRKSSPKCTRCGKATRWTPVHKGHAGRPWTVCTPCLFPSERRIRMRNRRKALARAKAWLESLPSPEKVKRPPLAVPRGAGWERTCVTPGCDIVVTHRKKKCTKCRERDRQLAADRLAAHHGRGRRVDLERAG